MGDDFSTWMLAQLHDPKLKEKAKARMAQSPVAQSSATQSPVTRSPSTQQRFIQVAKPHEEGFWKAQLLRDAPHTAKPSTKQLQQQIDGLFEQTAEKAYALRLARGGAEEDGEMPPVDRLPSYLLGRLYVLTEDIVCAHHRGSTLSGYSEDAYLSFALGAKGKNTLVTFLNRAAEHLPPADEETLRHFGLDAKGRPILWWDPEGVIRDHHPVSRKTVRRLQEKPAQLSKVWLLPPLVIRILFLYNAAMDVIESAERDDSIRWNNRMMRDYLFAMAGGSVAINPYSYTIVDSLLRLAEERVRVEIAGIAPIQTERDRREVARRLPKPLEEAVMKAIRETSLPPITEEDFRLLPAEEKLSLRLRQKWIFLLADEDKQVAVLDEMGEKEIHALLTRRGCPESKSPALLRLQRFFALRRKKEDAITASAIREIVDPSWEEELRERLQNLSERTPHWVSELSKQLTAWQSPKVRTLRLNRSRIHEAKKELAQTVAMVDRLLTTENKEETHDE